MRSAHAFFRASVLHGVAALTLLFVSSSCASPAPAEKPLSLVLLIAVDQLGRDRLDPKLPGGLGRLAREGRVFSAAALDHAGTTTCAGHATMLTGRHPGPMGVPGNTFVQRETLERLYCVTDASPNAAVIGGTGGRSPRNFEATALGDWMKRVHPETRVFSVSGKDRAAIALGGQQPDAAYWFEWSIGRFTTSRYYRKRLPAWVRRWRMRGLPARWEHASGNPANGARLDDYRAEDPLNRRTSPHPLKFLGQLYASPFADDMTLRFALELVRAERLGKRRTPDLLAISLSSTDLIGHLYGPESQEALDALQRLDRSLASFLGKLERRIGRGRTLIVLTSDHGVMPLPEWLLERGRSECPLPGGRALWGAIEAGVEQVLRQRFGPAGGSHGWLIGAGMRLTVNWKLAAERGVDLRKVIEAAREHLQQLPGVARVWTASELEHGVGPQPFLGLYQNSHHRSRGGDLIVQPERGCLLSTIDYGTSHGTPYAYDREVPLVFFGPGVEPGEVKEPAATVDIAPTLAAALGIPTPENLDGRVLQLSRPEPGAGTKK